MVNGKYSRTAGLPLLSCTKEHDTLGMEVNEGLQERNIDPALLEPVRELHGMVPITVPTRQGWLRLAYTLEFLIAVLTIFTLWSEVGGQGHLDLLPWYIKLICVLGTAWCCVRFTAGMVEQTKAWNRRSAGWLLGIVFFAIAMGSIVYYYHLHEEPDDDSNDTTAAVSASGALNT
jgi:hypothetical protein